MTRISLGRVAAATTLLATFAACEHAGGLGPRFDPAAPPALVRIECTVNVRASTLACAQPSAQTGGAAHLVVGGQGTYVYLEGSNVGFNEVNDVWSADVTVQNLIPQALGTTDGSALDPAGVRVFFETLPTPTSGSGAVTILNATGTATFTASNQPYYQWSEVLAPNQTSGALTWDFGVTPDVAAFTFAVYVAAQVQFPDGWVDVTGAPDTVVADGTPRSLTAVVRSVVGNELPGETVHWTTSDPSIATVTESGAFTPVGGGGVTITATSGPRSGAVSVAVCPDLAVGEVFTSVMPGAAGLCFAGGTSGVAEYTYMPVNLSVAAPLGLSITPSGIVSATGPPNPNLIPGGAPRLSLGGGPAALADAPLRHDEEAHVRRMQRDARELAPLTGRPSARVSRTARPDGPRALITKGPGTMVGDLMTLNVAPGCSGARDNRTGRVVSLGQHIILLADTMNPAGGFSVAQYDSIAMEFDSIAHPVVVDNFGAPTDLDANGRVVAFYTRAVNELSPPGGGVVDGYFTARDLYNAGPEGCPRSNEGEMFYMPVPDPTGEVNGNVRTLTTVRGGTLRTLGHEFQHLVNASRRIYVHGVGPDEEVWLNDGLSHIVEELMFYRIAPGLAPRQNITLAMLTTGTNASARVAAFNRFSNPNFGRLRPFLQRPDTTGVYRSNDVLATRGATWAFLRYAADRRNGNDADFWYSLVNTTLTGRENLEAALGADPRDWVRDWIAAMYADDAVPGIGAAYQTTSWNYRSVYSGLGGFPMLTRLLAEGTPLTLTYSPGGGTAYVRFGVPAGSFGAVTALSGGAPPVSPYALIVVRTK
jgi:hypothetical protein